MSRPFSTVAIVGLLLAAAHTSATAAADEVILHGQIRLRGEIMSADDSRVVLRDEQGRLQTFDRKLVLGLRYADGMRWPAVLGFMRRGEWANAQRVLEELIDDERQGRSLRQLRALLRCYAEQGLRRELVERLALSLEQRDTAQLDLLRGVSIIDADSWNEAQQLEIDTQIARVGKTASKRCLAILAIDAALARGEAQQAQSIADRFRLDGEVAFMTIRKLQRIRQLLLRGAVAAAAEGLEQLDASERAAWPLRCALIEADLHQARGELDAACLGWLRLGLNAEQLADIRAGCLWRAAAALRGTRPREAAAIFAELRRSLPEHPYGKRALQALIEIDEADL